MAKRKYTVYLDDEVWDKFAESTKDTGMSVSQLIELMMKVNASPTGKKVEGIFESIFRMGAKYGKEKK
jgi:hypothetical protein